jgi:hypothetical protein
MSEPPSSAIRLTELAATAEALATLRRQTAALVVNQRWASPGAMFYRPEPYAAESRGRTPGRWLPHAPVPLTVEERRRQAHTPVLCGLDAAGRVLTSHVDDGSSVVEELITYGSEGVEVVTVRDGGPIAVAHLTLEEGRPVRLLESEGDDRPGVIASSEWRYEFDPAGRIGGWAFRSIAADAPVYRYRVLHDAESGEWDRIVGVDDSGAPGDTVYDARLRRVEHDLPSLDEAVEGLAEGLVAAWRAAIRQALVDVAPDDEPAFALLPLNGWARDEQGPFPGSRGVLVTRRHVEQARRASPALEAVIAMAAQAIAPAGANIALDALDHADHATLRGIRRANQALERVRLLDEHPRAGLRAIAPVIRQLARDLNDPASGLPIVVVWVDEAEPLWEVLDPAVVAWEQGRYRYTESGQRLSDVLPRRDLLLDDGDHWNEPEPGGGWMPDETVRRRLRWLLTADAIGGERVAALRRSMSADTPARHRAPLDAPPANRPELRDLAASLGLERVADRIAEDALVGLMLCPDDSGRARSYLGGAPALPADLVWPHVDDRPIAFLASIDCAELPPCDGRELLPTDGTLLVWVDVAGGGLGNYDHGWGEPGGGGHLCIHHLPAGTTTRIAAPPAVLAEPDEEWGTEQIFEPLRVSARPALTIPYAGLAEARFELSVYEMEAYWRLEDRCRAAWQDDPGVTGLGGRASAQMFGHIAPVQDDYRVGEQVLLLQVKSFGPFRFDYLDAGSIDLIAEPDDLRAGRFDRVLAFDASG